MEPTLEASDSPSGTLRDRLLVEKLSYRFHPPQRNDLVVFKAPPELEAQNLHDDVVQIHGEQTSSTARLSQNVKLSGGR